MINDRVELYYALAPVILGCYSVQTAAVCGAVSIHRSKYRLDT